ncbi:MAG: TetR/AcrR family transcriptional regulator [Oscillochloridaceae bacterium umkhey_bin13]
MSSRSTRSQRLKTASSERRERERQALRETILAAARRLLLEHGYAGLSLRQVAEAIGYTPTTIYLHFADKDDLLFAVIDQAFDQFTRDLEVAYASTPDPAERLRALAAAYLAFGRQQPEAYQVIFLQRPDFLLKWKAGSQQPRANALQFLRQAVSEAQAAGVVRPGDPLLLSNLIWASVHGAVALAITMPQLFGAADQEPTFAAVIEAALRGVAP